MQGVSAQFPLKNFHSFLAALVILSVQLQQITSSSATVKRRSEEVLTEINQKRQRASGENRQEVYPPLRKRELRSKNGVFRYHSIGPRYGRRADSFQKLPLHSSWPTSANPITCRFPLRFPKPSFPAFGCLPTISPSLHRPFQWSILLNNTSSLSILTLFHLF